MIFINRSPNFTCLTICLDKCPQAFTKKRKFIEDSRARLEDNKTTILDAIDALKEEKTALKEQEIENEKNEEKVNNQFNTVKVSFYRLFATLSSY